MIASDSAKIQSDGVCGFSNQSVICIGLCIVDSSISENGCGNSEITLLFFISLGVIELHCVFHLGACEVNKSGNDAEYLLMCAKYVLLVTAKNCDLVCEVGQVVKAVVYPDLCL